MGYSPWVAKSWTQLRNQNKNKKSVFLHLLSHLIHSKTCKFSPAISLLQMRKQARLYPLREAVWCPGVIVNGTGSNLGFTGCGFLYKLTVLYPSLSMYKMGMIHQCCHSKVKVCLATQNLLFPPPTELRCLFPSPFCLNSM